MKRILCLTSLLFIGLVTRMFAQSNQSPVLPQTTSTTENRQANPPTPILQKTGLNEQMELEKGMDTTLPKNRPRPDRKQRRLPPDSLRRGGATRVDTIRH